MPGRKSKSKGYRTEHVLEKLLKDAGFKAERIPLSGAQGGSFTGDILIEGKLAEVKARANGFKELYKWLEGKDLLFLKADYKGYLVVIRIEDFITNLKE